MMFVMLNDWTLRQLIFFATVLPLKCLDKREDLMISHYLIER